MSTPTLYMGLPNPTPFGDFGTWANEIVTCNTGFDTLAVSVFISVSATGSLSVYNGRALIQATGGAGGITLTLPDVTNGGSNTANEGRVYSIVKVDSAAGAITVDPFSGGQTISGQSSLTISAQWTGYTIQSTSSGWVVLGIMDESVSGILPVSDGGTGSNLSATGGTSQVLRQSSVGGNITVSQLAASNLSNGTTGSGAVVLASAPTISGAITISGTATYTTANPVFFSSTGSGAVVLATSPSIANATLSGSITVSGTTTYTSANPVFFSEQGNGTKVQLSTGTTTTGDVVTYDSNGNTIDSGTLLTSLAPKASPSFTGTASFVNASVSGTMTYTSVNPTFFSSTGSGAVVLATSPTLVTPVLGAASATSLTTTTFVSVGSTITSYNGLTTAGNGVVTILAATSQKSESAADPSLLSFTPPAVAGTYRVRFVLSVSAASSAVLGWTITYTDSNSNAQTPTNVALNNLGAAPAALTYTTSLAGNYNGAVDIDIDNSATPIVVKFTLTAGTITAKASATIERII
jgi:hypothetical protein